MTRTVRAVASGDVQGVGFRWFVERLARGAGVTGYCRNRRDGTVEIVAAAEPGALEAFLAAVGEGPPAARVEALAVTSLPAEAFDGFRVLPTV